MAIEILLTDIFGDDSDLTEIEKALSFQCFYTRLRSWIFERNPNAARSLKLSDSYFTIENFPEEEIFELIDNIPDSQLFRAVVFDPNFYPGYPLYWMRDLVPYVVWKLSGTFPILTENNTILYDFPPDVPFYERLTDIEDTISRILLTSYQDRILRVWNLLLPNSWGLENVFENFYRCPALAREREVLDFYRGLDNGKGRLSFRVHLNAGSRHQIAEYFLSRSLTSFFFSSHLENHEGRICFDFSDTVPFSSDPDEKFPVFLEVLRQKIFEISALTEIQAQNFFFARFDEAVSFSEEKEFENAVIYLSENFHPWVLSVAQNRYQDLRIPVPFEIPISITDAVSVTNDIVSAESQMRLYLRRIGIFDPQIVTSIQNGTVLVRGPKTKLDPTKVLWVPNTVALGSGIIAQYLAKNLNLLVENGIVSTDPKNLKSIYDFSTSFKSLCNNPRLDVIQKESDGRNLSEELFELFRIKVIFETANEYLVLFPHPNFSAEWFEESRRRIKKELLPLWRFSLSFSKTIEEMRIFLHLCYQQLCEKYPLLLPALDQILLLPDGDFLIPVISTECAFDFETLLFENRDRKIFIFNCPRESSNYYFVRGVYFKKGICGSFEPELKIFPLREQLIELAVPESEFFLEEDGTLFLHVGKQKIFIGHFTESPEIKTFHQNWRRNLLHSLWGKNYLHHTGKISSYPIFL